MQEKEFNKESVDQSLMEKGWQQMFEVLEREMPVERKRRGLVWWYLSGVAAILLAVMVVWNPSQSEEISANLAMEDQTPIDEEQIEGSDEELALTAENKTAVVSIQENKTSENESLNDIDLAEARIEKQGYFNQKIRTAEEERNDPETAIPKIDENKIDGQNSLPVKRIGDLVLSEVDSLKDDDRILQERASESIVMSLKPLHYSISPLVGSPRVELSGSDLNQEGIRKDKRNWRFHPSLSAGMIFPYDQSLNLGFKGLSGIELKNQGWAFYLGLGLEQIHFQSFAANEEVRFSAGNSTSFSVQKATLFQIPFSVSRRLSNKLHLIIGTDYHALFQKIGADQQTVLTDNSDLQSSGENKDPGSSPFISYSSDSTRISYRSFGLFGGLEYQLSRKLQIQFLSQYHFKPMFEHPRLTDPSNQKYWTLLLKYDF